LIGDRSVVTGFARAAQPRQRARLLHTLALYAALLSCASARGDSAKDPRTQARAHFRAGTAFYDAGEYGRAIDEYKTAYKLVPVPELLFNLAQAYRLNDNPAAAIDHYGRYLALKQTGPVADEAREHLQELTRPQPAPPRPQPAPPKPVVAPSSPVPAPSPPVLSPVPVVTTPVAPPQVSPVDRRRRRWLLPVLIAAGVVVVGVAVGVAVGVSASGTRYPAATFGEVTPK
jgi:tetratricopeptide (TPR) repeat protein